MPNTTSTASKPRESGATKERRRERRALWSVGLLCLVAHLPSFLGPLAGGLIGGQLGASVSRRLSGVVLVRLLATVLIVAALSLVIQHVDALFGARH